MTRPTNKPERRNFVAKHAKRAGAGPHRAKSGDHAPRSRQKNQLRRAIAEFR